VTILPPSLPPPPSFLARVWAWFTGTWWGRERWVWLLSAAVLAAYVAWIGWPGLAAAAPIAWLLRLLGRREDTSRVDWEAADSVSASRSSNVSEQAEARQRALQAELDEARERTEGLRGKALADALKDAQERARRR
jgi:hypothetical protein